ncbi:MAG: ABC transporter permease [Firmicutes bacterium HGW-Firmicutes-2]|jgi:rhamnose transport system permease protein|nr:MAG: ABC transporter permease [Firmicutes bacterium HGW-Firmicutes-2]
MSNQVESMKSTSNPHLTIKDMLKSIVKNRSFGLMMACVVLLILASQLTPQLLTVKSLNDMLKNNSIAGILAIGMLMVLVTRGIDLSIAATMVFSGLVISMINADNPEVPIFALVLLAILIGTVIGIYNGLLVSKLKLLPIIATLSTLYIVRGLAYVVSQSRWIVPANYTNSYKSFAVGNLFGVNNLIITGIIMFFIFYVILTHLKFGRRIFAIGSSPDSAEVSGIKSDMVIIAVYALMGAIAGFSGFLYTSNYAIAQSTMAMGMEMDVIAICILGGVSINGGTGKISGIIIATVLFAIISSFLSMLSGLSIWTDAIKGVIIIGAVILNIYTSRSSKQRALRERNI